MYRTSNLLLYIEADTSIVLGIDNLIYIELILNLSKENKLAYFTLFFCIKILNLLNVLKNLHSAHQYSMGDALSTKDPYF